MYEGKDYVSKTFFRILIWLMVVKKKVQIAGVFSWNGLWFWLRLICCLFTKIVFFSFYRHIQPKLHSYPVSISTLTVPISSCCQRPLPSSVHQSIKSKCNLRGFKSGFLWGCWVCPHTRLKPLDKQVHHALREKRLVPAGFQICVALQSFAF